MTFAEERQMFNESISHSKDSFTIFDNYGFGIKEFQFEGFVNADPERKLDHVATHITDVMTYRGLQLGRYNGDLPFDYYENCVDIRGLTQNAAHYIGINNEMSMKCIIDMAIARMYNGWVYRTPIRADTAIIVPYTYHDATYNIKLFLITACFHDPWTNNYIYPKNLSAIVVYDRNCHTKFNKIILGVNYDMIFGNGFKILPGLNHRRDNAKPDIINTITDVDLRAFVYNVFGYVKTIQDCDINKVQTTNVALDAYAKHNPTWKGIGCVPLTYYNLCKVIAMCAEPGSPSMADIFFNPENDSAIYKSEVLNGRYIEQ